MRKVNEWSNYKRAQTVRRTVKPCCLPRSARRMSLDKTQELPISQFQSKSSRMSTEPFARRLSSSTSTLTSMAQPLRLEHTKLNSTPSVLEQATINESAILSNFAELSGIFKSKRVIISISLVLLLGLVVIVLSPLFHSVLSPVAPIPTLAPTS